MRSRKFFAFFPLICFLVAFFVPNVSFAAGIIPLNVAVLPAFNADKAEGALVEKVQAKVIRHFRYPYYEIITDSDKTDKGFAAMNDAFKMKKKPYDEDVMRRIAQEMSADIVVMAELAKVRSRIYYSWRFDGDDYEETYVVLNCYTYAAQDGKYNKATVSDRNFDAINVLSGLDTAVPNLTDKLLEKIPYKTIIPEE